MDRCREWIDCGPESYISALCIIQRLENVHAIPPLTQRTVHRVFFTSLMLAVKFLEDTTLRNEDFAKVGCLTPLDLARMELHVLKALHFSSATTVDEYQSCKTTLLGNFRRFKHTFFAHAPPTVAVTLTALARGFHILETPVVRPTAVPNTAANKHLSRMLTALQIRRKAKKASETPVSPVAQGNSPMRTRPATPPASQKPQPAPSAQSRYSNAIHVSPASTRNAHNLRDSSAIRTGRRASVGCDTMPAGSELAVQPNTDVGYSSGTRNNNLTVPHSGTAAATHEPDGELQPPPGPPSSPPPDTSDATPRPVPPPPPAPHLSIPGQRRAQQSQRPSREYSSASSSNLFASSRRKSVELGNVGSTRRAMTHSRHESNVRVSTTSATVAAGVSNSPGLRSRSSERQHQQHSASFRFPRSGASTSTALAPNSRDQSPVVLGRSASSRSTSERLKVDGSDADVPRYRPGLSLRSAHHFTTITSGTPKKTPIHTGGRQSGLACVVLVPSPPMTTHTLKPPTDSNT